jgi:hypothetical protein
MSIQSWCQKANTSCHPIRFLEKKGAMKQNAVVSHGRDSSSGESCVRRPRTLYKWRVADGAALVLMQRQKSTEEAKKKGYRRKKRFLCSSDRGFNIEVSDLKGHFQGMFQFLDSLSLLHLLHV